MFISSYVLEKKRQPSTTVLSDQHVSIIGWTITVETGQKDGIREEGGRGGKDDEEETEQEKKGGGEEGIEKEKDRR